MTNQTTETKEASKKPGFIAKVRHIHGKTSSYERIGVAWQNEDGSLYIKLAGTQIVSDFYLYKSDPTDSQPA